MNDRPGFSIFQGGDSIHLNNSGTEEKEALEDQIRRNNELQNQLQNAFDDLEDEDENETRNSSISGLDSHTLQRHSNGPKFHNRSPPAYGVAAAPPNGQEINHLKNLLESKMREYDHVSKLLIDERRQTDSKLNDMKKKLSLAEVERDRANMTRQQTHELLVESKTKISGLEDTIKKLNDRIKGLETKNTDLFTELEHTKTMLSDAEHKFMLVERDNGIVADRRVQVTHLQEQHRAKVEMMQQQIDNLRGQLADRDHECKTLDARYKEVQRSREALLVEKSETINQLAKNLEEVQGRHCQNVIAAPQLAQENIRLQTKVSALEQQTEDMQRTIRNLSQKLESTNNELEIMDSMMASNDLSHCKPPVASTPMQPDEKLTKLKSELYRCMSAQKLKRDEIRQLQDQLQERSAEIKRLKNEENRALVQMNQYQEENARLTGKLNVLEAELGQVKGGGLRHQIDSLQSKTEELEKNLQECAAKHGTLAEDYEKLLLQSQEERKLHTQLQSELEKNKFTLSDAQAEGERVKQRYIELADAKERLEKELSQLARGDKEVASMTDQLPCTKCIGKEANLVKVQIENVELQNSCTSYLKQINSLKAELHDMTAQIADLRRKLDTKSDMDRKIEELREQALKFQEFMKSQSTNTSAESGRQDASISPPTFLQDSRELKVNTTPPPPQQPSPDVEHRVREEMAKVFAGQIKVLENKFKAEIFKFEQNLKALRQQLDEKEKSLQISRQNVEVLKMTILSERQQVQSTLADRDQSVQPVLDRQREVIKRQQTEIEKLETTVQSLYKELTEKKKQMAVELQQMDDDRRALMDREEVMMARNKREHDELKKTIDKMTAQCEELERTRKWHADKSAHMEKEAHRISGEFKSIRDRLKKQSADLIEKVVREKDQEMERVRREYASKLDTLREEFDRKAAIK